MITIIKHGQDPATRVAISRLLEATRATKLGTAYDLDGDIPARLATVVTRVEQLQQQTVKPQLREDPGLLDDIEFMFQFFQANARQLAITPEQKTRLKPILERVKASRAT